MELLLILKTGVLPSAVRLILLVFLKLNSFSAIHPAKILDACFVTKGFADAGKVEHSCRDMCCGLIKWMQGYEIL